MLVKCILIIQVHSLAKVTQWVIFLDVQLIWILIVNLLLEHQHWLVVEAELAQGLPVISLIVVPQLISCLEFSHRLLVTVSAYEAKLACHIDLDGRVLKP